MKLLMRAAFGLALIGALTLTPGAVSATNDGENTSQFCRGIEDHGYTHGACVAHFGQADNTTPAKADVCRQPDRFEATGAKNRGECIKVIVISP